MFEFEIKKKTRNGSIRIALHMNLVDLVLILRVLCFYN